jgi:hypothetical protein
MKQCNLQKVALRRDMTRFLRRLLYWLALVAGLIGLVAGGRLLAKYAVARFNDPYFDSFSYNDLVFSGGVIFLLSLMLLIFTDLARTLSGFAPPGPGKTAAIPAPPGEIAKFGGATPPATPAPIAEPDRESADEKLARLLKQKGE